MLIGFVILRYLGEPFFASNNIVFSSANHVINATSWGVDNFFLTSDDAFIGINYVINAKFPMLKS